VRACLTVAMYSGNQRFHILTGISGHIPKGREHGNVCVGMTQHARRAALAHLFDEVNQFGDVANINGSVIVRHRDAFLVTIV